MERHDFINFGFLHVHLVSLNQIKYTDACTSWFNNLHLKSQYNLYKGMLLNANAPNAPHCDIMSDIVSTPHT